MTQKIPCTVKVKLKADFNKKLDSIELDLKEKLLLNPKLDVLDSKVLQQIAALLRNSNYYHLYTPEETVRRAESRLGERNYNIATNNCEHFAIWCKTGNSESTQVENFIQMI